MTAEQGGQQTGEAGGATTTPLGGMAPGLLGVRGRLRLDIGDETFGVLVVDNGHVQLEKPGDPTDALVCLSSADDLQQVLRGEVNPVVLALLGREQIQGDLLFAIKVLLGLREGSPFKIAAAGAQLQGG